MARSSATTPAGPSTTRSAASNTSGAVSVEAATLGDSTDGTVRYPSADGSHVIEAQPVSDYGLRFLVHLEDSRAPVEYLFDLEIPTGASVSATASDSAVIVKPGSEGPDMPLAVIGSPIAFDADGKKVPVTQDITSSSIGSAPGLVDS